MSAAWQCRVAYLLATTGVIQASHADQVYFLGLGDLPGGSSFHSVAGDISADGTTVVGRSTGVNGSEAFRWTAAGGMVGIGDLPGGDFWSGARAVSADGSVVAGSSDSSQSSASCDACTEAFRWTGEGGIEGLGDFWGGDFASQATGISGDGSFVVGRGDPDEIGPHVLAFGWTRQDGLFQLGDLPGGRIDSIANAVSSDGSTVVGWAESDDGTEAFRWTAQEGMVGLGDLPGGRFSSNAKAVSADGSVIVGAGDVGYYEGHVFRWTQQQGLVDLGFTATPQDVSADGSVIVGDAGGGAFIWDQTHGFRFLHDIITAHGIDMGDWQLAFVHGVSADGRTIVGTAYHDNLIEAWIAHIPEPTTLPLFVLAMLLATRRRPRRTVAQRSPSEGGEPIQH
ncbi:MAG TPA: PEP-CTERM sorting domain-containing protein [Phycisphaerae bacterium]|nr:PEP-CTERM sorting domain-containing protein [Phycisphaerae bacterium]